MRGDAAGWYSSDATAPSKQDARAVLARAHELGIGFFNSSDIYGPFTNEELIGAQRTHRGPVWVPRCIGSPFTVGAEGCMNPQVHKLSANATLPRPKRQC